MLRSQQLPYVRHCEERSDEAIHLTLWLWIASRSLSSGAHSRDPLARNDEGYAGDASGLPFSTI
jgi:hypothetical protein